MTDIGSVINEVKKLKTDAKTQRDLGETEEALLLIDRAINVLSRATGNVELKSSDRDKQTMLSQLNAQLADCWGIRGGILRRSGRLPEALEAYNTGRKFEVGDSYNLTNSLVLTLLIDFASFEKVRPQIEGARIEVAAQIQRHRAGEWWAWADLGLLSLLSGHEDRAVEAYAHFAATGARASDYDSTISVLEELAKGIDGENDDLKESLSRACSFLRSQKR